MKKVNKKEMPGKKEGNKIKRIKYHKVPFQKKNCLRKEKPKPS